MRAILRDVRENGDAAVLKYCEAFDGGTYSTLRLGDDEVQSAYDAVESETVDALRFAAERIRAFHEEQLQHALRSFRNDGVGVQA